MHWNWLFCVLCRFTVIQNSVDLYVLLSHRYGNSEGWFNGKHSSQPINVYLYSCSQESWLHMLNEAPGLLAGHLPGSCTIQMMNGRTVCTYSGLFVLHLVLLMSVWSHSSSISLSTLRCKQITLKGTYSCTAFLSWLNYFNHIKST